MKVRASSLKTGDIFRMLGYLYFVHRVEDGKIYYIINSQKCKVPKPSQYMSANSKQWVEVENYKIVI